MAAKARIIIPLSVADELWRDVPSWHACLHGPRPFGRPDRVTVTIDHIWQPTREEAEGACWRQARVMCENNSYPFNEEEWEILHLDRVAACS